MQVVIPLASLQKYGACRAYLDSPEWDKERQALVYNEWYETSQRLLSSMLGRRYLGWLVAHNLVPMSADDLNRVMVERSFPLSKNRSLLTKGRETLPAQDRAPGFSPRITRGRDHG